MAVLAARPWLQCRAQGTQQGRLMASSSPAEVRSRAAVQGPALSTGGSRGGGRGRGRQDILLSLSDILLFDRDATLRTDNESAGY